VDCKVYSWDDRNNTTQDILYVEFKRASLSEAGRREAVNQVSEYCRDHNSSPSDGTLTMMVCYGTQATFWVARQLRASRTCFPFYDNLTWYDANSAQARDVLKMLQDLATLYDR
jgi:hypothetical protein